MDIEYVQGARMSMTQNTGPIIGRCEYTKQPLRKVTMYDLCKQAERDAVARRKEIIEKAKKQAVV